MTAPHLRKGQAAEAGAAEVLENAGLTILARNVRFKCGEIDLIARDGTSVVFVEVRARRSAAFGRPEETVDARKQARLIAAAELWLQRHDPAGTAACRFDIIAVEGAGDQADIRWHRNAFEGS